MAVKKPAYYKRLVSLCKSKTDLKVLSPVGSNTCIHQERAVRACWYKNVPTCIGHMNTALLQRVLNWDILQKLNKEIWLQVN